MENNDDSAREIKQTPEPLRATFSYYGQETLVEVFPDDLQRDLRQEAQRRGIDPAAVEGLLSRTSFALTPINEYIRKTVTGLRRLFQAVERKQDARVAAMVVENERGQTDCIFDLGRLARAIELGGNFEAGGHQHMITRADDKREVLKNALDAVWLHEREHLLQKADPQKQKEAGKDRRRHKLITVAHVGLSMALGLYGYMWSRDPSSPYFITCALSAAPIVSGAVEITRQAFTRFSSKDEKEAIVAMSSNRSNNTLFTIMPRGELDVLEQGFGKPYF